MAEFSRIYADYGRLIVKVWIDDCATVANADAALCDVYAMANSMAMHSPHLHSNVVHMNGPLTTLPVL